MQHDVEEADGGKADDEYYEGRITAMRQNLVDDHLEEQRRHQRKDLDDEGGDQHMAEGTPIAPDRRQEPAEPEILLRGAGASETALDEDELARGQSEKLLGVDIAGGKIDGVDQPITTLGGRAGEDCEGAILQGDKCRRRKSRQPFGVICPDDARLQADDFAARSRSSCVAWLVRASSRLSVSGRDAMRK